MGSQQFEERRQIPKKQSDSDAFRDLIDMARHEHGHGGYSGTVAEKNSVISIHRARSEKIADRMVRALMGHAPIPIFRDELIQVADDKWGPAGAVRYPIDAKTDGIIFFGWASS